MHQQKKKNQTNQNANVSDNLNKSSDKSQNQQKH